MDVWVTQVGSGQFYNLTRDAARELVNPSVRTLGFSPDGTLVTFWARSPAGTGQSNINVWGAPVLGGPPRPYLDGVAEYDWSSDGARLVYHTPGPGDPMFVRDSAQAPEARAIFTAPPGLHSHFPIWSLDHDVHLLCSGHGTRSHGRVAHQCDGRSSRADHESRLGRHPSGLPESANAALSRERLGRVRTMDLQPRCEAAHFSPGQRRHRQVHLARSERRRQPSRCDHGTSGEHALAPADHRCTRRVVGRPSHPADDRQRILSTAGRRLPAVRLFQGCERQYLEAARRCGHRGVERAGYTDHRRAHHRARRASHCILDQAKRPDVAVRCKC